MLKRKAYNSITKWYNKNLKKCLLVDGARQIGKTYIIRKFLEENSKSFVEFNLYDDNLRPFYEFVNRLCAIYLILSIFLLNTSNVLLSHQHESVVLNLHKHHFSFYLFYLRA